MTLVELIGVEKYQLKTIFDLKIEEGKSYLISGANGSGKTTLIRLILGFIQPDRGSITRNTSRMNYLPEHKQLPADVLAITYLLIVAKLYKSKLDEDLLHLLNVQLFKPIGKLSKGNQQRIAILQSVIGHPALIIFDEPLSGLDRLGVKQFLSLCKSLRNRQIGYLISTHQPKRFLNEVDVHLVL